MERQVGDVLSIRAGGRFAACFSLLVAALSACATAPVKAPAPVPRAATQASGPVETPVESAQVAIATPPPENETPLPDLIAHPANVACSWSTGRWLSRTIATLSLRPNGPVFARITGGKARVHFAVGARDHGVVDVSSGGLFMSGVISREDVFLFAAAPFPMNGVVFPASSTSLSLGEGFADGVRITMDAPPGMLVKNPPLTAKRPCTDLSLDSGTNFSPVAAALGTEYSESKFVPSGRTLEVFSDPSRPADVRLVIDTNTFAYASATRGAFTRVGMFVQRSFVAGWVRSNNLLDAHGGTGGSGLGFGRRGIVSTRLTPIRTVRCASDVPLVVEAAGETATVGIAERGQNIDVVEDAHPYSRVQVIERNIHMVRGVRLLARASDLSTCAPVPR